LPYVEDQLVWKNPQSKKDGYDIIEGNRSLLVSLDSSDRRQKNKGLKCSSEPLYYSHCIPIR
jgi:hypothetical protein